MAHRGPQDQIPHEAAASLSSGDLFDDLVKAIVDASHDPTQLRQLVILMARHNIGLDAVLLRAQSETTPDELVALQRALEGAIQRVEAETRIDERSGSIMEPVDEPNPFDRSWRPVGSQTDPPSASDKSKNLLPHPTTANNPIVVIPERMPLLESDDLQLWIDHRIQVYLRSMDFVPRPNPVWSGLVLFIQLASGAAIGLGLVVAMTGWPPLSRQPAPAHDSSQQAEAPATPSISPVGTMHDPRPPEPRLPFPLPRTFGVYAASDGVLVELEPLPIKVPVPRVRVSAEITAPSKATVTGEKLAFVVYRRDLVNNAPQSVSVRVVARVSRAMKFIDGKPKITPVVASWRIRDKSYELKVSPLQGNREMILIQTDPGFVLTPGRYALVLNGYGYDFTVAGTATALEQCLEQVQLTDGIVLSECPKS